MRIVSVDVARWLHIQKRPFKIVLEDPMKEALIFQSEWHTDGSVSFKFTGMAASATKGWAADDIFGAVENLYRNHLYTYPEDTVFDKRSAIPMNWDDLPLPYKWVTDIKYHDKDDLAYGLNGKGDVVMEFTRKGAHTAQTFDFRMFRKM